MKATFDFIPRYCPDCGQALQMAGYALDDFRAGSVLTCNECCLEMHYAAPPEQAQPTEDPERCGLCGGPLGLSGGIPGTNRGERFCMSCYQDVSGQ